MTTFALLLFAAAIAYGLSRVLRITALPMLIGAGMLLNLTGLLPADFAFTTSGKNNATHFLEFGLLFLVFTSGLELNPRRFVKHGKTVSWVAAIQFSLSAVIGYATARISGFPPLEATYLGLGLAASSTLVVLRQLRSRKALFEPFGRVVTGVLLLQDLLLIAVIVILSRLDAKLPGISLAIGETALLVAAAWFAQRRAIPWLIKRMKPDEESLLLWLVAVLFLFTAAAHWIGLPLIVGAFAAGFAFSAFPLNGLIRGQMSSLADFFQSLFFVTLGALVGVPDAANCWTALQFSAIVFIITPPLVAAVAEWRSLNSRASIESGLILAQTSEFSILLAIAGLSLGHLSPTAFEVIAMTTLITMTLTPFLSRERLAHSLLKLHPFRRRTPILQPPQDPILVLGFGSAGMWTIKPLLAHNQKILVIDDDAVVCQNLNRLGIPVIRGDGADEQVLLHAGAPNAKLIIASMRRIDDAIHVMQAVPGIPTIVRVFESSEAETVRNLGGIPIENSTASADQFIQWFNNTFPRKNPSQNPG